jgi:capsular polysaccharide biosynthesis protein
MLRDRIGEQKIILNDLIMLASPYCSRDSEFDNLCRNLQNIKDTYRDVKITYTIGEPVSVEKDGGLVVTQTETSKVDMTNEQLSAIIDVTKNIRNKLITK